MGSGVLVLGRVAAADVPAFETGAEMHPAITKSDAFVADVCAGWLITCVGEVLAKSHMDSGKPIELSSKISALTITNGMLPN